MPTTTNYSWTTPADTDLVKDGASAIRTLGTAIDTTTKNLNPSTTLGDIEYRSSTANTNTRLGIGSTGNVLTVSGGVPTWAAPVAGGMTLISTTTLTGASVTLSSIPSTYNELKIYIKNYLSAGDGYPIQMRFNGDTASNRHFANLTVAENYGASFNATFVRVVTYADSAVGDNLTVLEIPDYANSTTMKFFTSVSLGNNETTTTQFNSWFNYGFYNQTTAISSLTFLPQTGNFGGGQILLYGVK